MLKQMLQELGVKKIALILGVGVLFLFGTIFIVYRLYNPSLAPLYSNLSPENISSISSKLSLSGIKYQVSSENNTILIPADKVLVTRMNLAAEGLPASSNQHVGYELFDNSNSLGTSSIVHNINVKRSLEGELAKTIMSFDSIKSARVHIVLPKKNLFSKVKQKTKASIVIRLKHRYKLDQSQVNAISHLVSTGVSDLEPQNITIVDTNGRPLQLGTGHDKSEHYFATSREEYRKQYEEHIIGIATSMLEKIVGEGKVIVRVTADIDFDRVITNSEIYDPESSVVRSSQVTENKESTRNLMEHDNVSVENNIPNSEGHGNVHDTRGEKHNSNETINYEISKTIRNYTKGIGSINKLSVAILVDGEYKMNPETQVREYSSRSEETLENFAKLVKSAIGFDDVRGDTIEIISQKFVIDDPDTYKIAEPKYAWLDTEFENIIKTMIIALVVFTLILFVIRPIINKAIDISKQKSEELLILPDSESDDENADDPMVVIENEIKQELDDMLDDSNKEQDEFSNLLVKQLNTFIKKDVKTSSSILREWFYKG